jgi:glutamine amidotransferase
MMHPILDKYYERDPYHVRSSAFVQAKGLASNERAPTSGSLSPSVETGNGKLHGPANGTIRGLSPDVVRRSLLSPSLLREVAAVPPSGSSPNTPSSFPLRLSPAKGNIKVKRTSVHQIDEFPTGNDSTATHDEALSPGRNQINTGARGAKKPTQFFSELPLGAEAS